MGLAFAPVGLSVFVAIAPLAVPFGVFSLGTTFLFTNIAIEQASGLDTREATLANLGGFAVFLIFMGVAANVVRGWHVRRAGARSALLLARPLGAASPRASRTCTRLSSTRAVQRLEVLRLPPLPEPAALVPDLDHLPDSRTAASRSRRSLSSTSRSGCASSCCRYPAPRWPTGSGASLCLCGAALAFTIAIVSFGLATSFWGILLGVPRLGRRLLDALGHRVRLHLRLAEGARPGAGIPAYLRPRLGRRHDGAGRRHAARRAAGQRDEPRDADRRQRRDLGLRPARRADLHRAARGRSTAQSTRPTARSSATRRGWCATTRPYATPSSTSG